MPTEWRSILPCQVDYRSKNRPRSRRHLIKLRTIAKWKNLLLWRILRTSRPTWLSSSEISNLLSSMSIKRQETIRIKSTQRDLIGLFLSTPHLGDKKIRPSSSKHLRSTPYLSKSPSTTRMFRHHWIFKMLRLTSKENSWKTTILYLDHWWIFNIES